MNQYESMNDFRVLSRVHFRVQYRAQYREHSSIVCRVHFRVHLSLPINRLLGCSAGVICYLFIYVKADAHAADPLCFPQQLASCRVLENISSQPMDRWPRRSVVRAVVLPAVLPARRAYGLLAHEVGGASCCPPSCPPSCPSQLSSQLSPQLDC